LDRYCIRIQWRNCWKTWPIENTFYSVYLDRYCIRDPVRNC